MPKPLNKKQLAVEPDLQLRKNVRPLLEKFFASMARKVDEGDPKALELFARMVQYDKGPGGVTIFNQNNTQVNGVSPEQTNRVRSFDQIIGKLEDQASTQQALLAQPEEEMMDAEIV